MRELAAAHARDLQAVMRCHASSGDLVVFDVSNRPFRGVAAVTRDWQDFLTEMRAIDLQFRAIAVTVRPGSAFAYATFIERATLTPKAGPPMVADDLRTTQIDEKRNGRWVIVHEHKSRSRTD